MRAVLRVIRKILLVLASAALLLLLLRWVLFHGPVRDTEALPDGEIVDLHCHVAGIGAGDSGCRLSANLRDSFKFGSYLDAFGVTLEEVEEQGDALVVERLAIRIQQSEHVSRAVVLALDAFVDEEGVADFQRTEVYVPGDFVAEQVARHPELLYGASVHPHRADARDRLRQAKSQGAVLVKWLPNIQGIDPAEPRHDDYYRELVALDLPLLVHTGDERSFTQTDDRLGDPERLRRALQLGVRVIAAHVATTGRHDGVDNFDRLRALMEEFDQLFVEISSLTQINKRTHLDLVLTSDIPEERVLFGSDYPLISTLLVRPWYYPLHLEMAQIQELRRIENPFDRDVELKRMLGVPAAVFSRSATFLRLEDRP